MKIDLRKTFPLGLDFAAAYDRAVMARDKWLNMGPGDHYRPGWYEHTVERDRLAKVTLDFVALARIIAGCLPDRVAHKIAGLRFALHFRGMEAGVSHCDCADCKKVEKTT